MARRLNIELSGFSRPKTGSPSRHSVELAQVILLVILYLIPIFFALRLDQISDTDVWWHLRTGEWIAQNGAVPHTELFSNAAGEPWDAYSWLYEIFVYWLFAKIGLLGIVLYTASMVAAIAAAVHYSIRQANQDFKTGVVLTLLAMYTMGRIFTPRPWLLTIILFALELGILMQVRKTGRIRHLLWLPILFVLWANIHIQFIDGLVVLGIALAESLAARRWSKIQGNLPLGPISAIFAASIAGTLVNPYGWGVYKVAYDLVAQTGSIAPISELSAVSFRSMDDWCLLLLAIGAVWALARARRFTFFEWGLLAFAIFTSFRSQRDVWVLAIAGSMIAASGFPQDESDRFCVRAIHIPIICIVTSVAIVLGLKAEHLNNEQLQAKLVKDLPIHAVEMVKQQGWRGPLFNDFNWGGFLIWWMRIPVSMDGRTIVYGNPDIMRSYATWNGYPGWDSDPDLVHAGIVFAPVGTPLTQLLHLQPCMRTAYRDDLAEVFIPTETNAANLQTSPFCAARHSYKANR